MINFDAEQLSVTYRLKSNGGDFAESNETISIKDLNEVDELEVFSFNKAPSSMVIFQKTTNKSNTLRLSYCLFY